MAHAFGDATPKVAVFVHGLCENDESWGVRYGDGLRDDLGYTPVYVRYNTGLRVSDNGRRLAEILEHVVEAWPVEVSEIALIGHSMGGLVARSACHYGERDDRVWTGRLRHVFCLGTPHLGAPLERAANVASWPLGRLPETRPFADLFLNGRSAGIKDLRFGSCLEEDWCDCDPDEFLRDRCRECQFLDSATYCFIAATLSDSPRGPGGAIGDLLVTYRSASGEGRRRRIPFEAEHGSHVGRLDHLRLLNHPAVYERIHGWLAQDALRRAPSPANDARV